jgi:hypothetical protein
MGFKKLFSVVSQSPSTVSQKNKEILRELDIIDELWHDSQDE